MGRETREGGGRERAGGHVPHKCRVRISERVILLLLRLINGGQNGAIVITNAVLSHNERQRCGLRRWPRRPVCSGGRLCASWRGKVECGIRPTKKCLSLLLSFLLFFGFSKVTPTPRNQRENDAGFPNAMDTTILALGCFCRRPIPVRIIRFRLYPSAKSAPLRRRDV